MESSAKATYHLANPYTMLLAKGLELEKATHAGNVATFLSRGEESCLRRSEVCSQYEVAGWVRLWSVLGSTLASLLSGWPPESKCWDEACEMGS